MDLQKVRDKYNNLSDVSKVKYDQQVKKYLPIYQKEGSVKSFVALLKDKNLAISTQRNILTSLYYHYANEDNQRTAKKFYKHLDDMIKLEKSQPSNQTKLTYNWNQILDNFEKYKKTRVTDSEYSRNIILGMLFTKITPRRIQDYVELRLFKGRGKVPTEFNYYVPSRGMIYFNKYKTARTYKQQVVKLPVELNTIMKKTFKNLSSGDKLFNISQPRLTQSIKRILGTSVNGIRHAYVTNAYTEKPNMTNDEIKEMSNELGHSVEQDLNYRAKDMFE